MVDGTCAAGGTANLDDRSLSMNYEINSILRAPRLCRRLEAQFPAHLEEAGPVMGRPVGRRP